jgi:hypothetical protein
MPWLIEKQESPADRPKYWAGGCPIWTTDPDQAVRLCRQEDAVIVANGILNGYIVRIAEHIWEEY